MSSRSSSSASSYSSYEECFTAIQLDVLSRVDQIVSQSNAHPFSQLQELQQARVVHSVEKTDLVAVVHKSRTGEPSVLIQRVQVSANIGLYKAIAFTGQGLSKKQAQREAAEIVFRTVVAYLRYSPPRDLFEVAAPKQPIIPTKNQLKELMLDRLHLSALREIAAASATHSSGKFGILSIDLEQFERHLSINLEVSVLFRLLSSASHTRAHHLIVSEYWDVVNGEFVDDRKWDFNFGESQLVAEKNLAETVSSLLNELCEGCEKVFLVGHTLTFDLKWLDEMKVGRSQGLIECDIARAYRALINGGAFANMWEWGR